MSRPTLAYLAPFGTFMAFLGILHVLQASHVTPGGADSAYLLFPIQTAACAGVLLWFRRDYDFGSWRRAWLGSGIGVLVFAIWISPHWLFHQGARLEGFNPEIFNRQPWLYWTSLGFRFLRLVLIVPMVEEIFWRGFLLRYLIREEFLRVPFGTYSRTSNLIVALAFMFEHSPPDWPAAFLAGLLYNLVAYDTRSLRCCILAHGLTNGLLGIYIMMTRQWGFW